MRKSALILVLLTTACSAHQQQQAQSDVQNAVSAAPSAIASAAHAVQTNPKVRQAGRNLDDAALSAAVETAIAGQAGLNVFHIGATARDGVVTLTGTVSSRAIAATALATARHVRGVKRIVDELHVRS
jgi:osmotically-inducible protein OsmY